MTSARGIADMVRDVLAEPDLDPAVRALAIERFEARLGARARALLGNDREVTVTLGDDGVARVTDNGAALDDPKLAQRLALDLVASLAPVMGAARLDVKNGVRAAHRAAPQAAEIEAPSPEATQAPAPALHEVTLRLVRVVALQQARIAALEAASDQAPARDEAHRTIALELHKIEADLNRLQRS